MTTFAAHDRSRAAFAATASMTAFSAAAVGAGLGRGLVTTYLPVLLDDIRSAPGLIGTVMLVNTAAGFFVPLAVGLWSDRLHARGRSRTVPFIVGGSLVAAGGLVAIALGHHSTYVILALAAAVTYAGLNAVTTAHRALIPETFGDHSRAAATGAEELAVLGGTVLGVLAGGFLLDLGGWTPFALGAVALPLLAVPTYLRMRGRERTEQPAVPTRPPFRYYVRAALSPGARLVLAAQLLWVMGYIGLAPFFVLYAKHELGLAPRDAASLLAAFGLVTAIAMLAAGSVPPQAHGRTTLTGALLLGGGLLAASATNTLQFVAPAALAAAVGFGLVTTLGFPLFARYIPPGEEGAYTALFFAVRSIAGAIAVPAAGWTIDAAGSYRALLVAGGAVALTAVVPLAATIESGASVARPQLRRTVVLVGGLAALSASLLGAAVLITRTRLAEVDADLFGVLYGVGGTPRIVDAVLVHPHIQNYLALTLLAVVVAIVWRPEELVRILVLVPVSGLASFALVRLMWAIWARPRPEEVLGVEPANGHLWLGYASFPSGHVVVTVALVTAIASRLPWLGAPLAVYAAVLAITRVSYGAHFPFDVIAAVALGFATARVAAALLTETRLLAPKVVFPPGLRGRRRAARLRAVGEGFGVLAIGAFFALALTVGVPSSPEGGIIPGAREEELQLAILAVASLALAVSPRFPAVGGGIILTCSAATGILAALEYNPLFAAGAAAALFVPGLLLALGSPRVRTSRGTAFLAATALAVIAVGAFGAFSVYAAAFGPTHPESQLRPLPVTVIRWAWAGGVSDSGFRVVAKLAFDGDARLLVSPDRGLRGAVATPLRRASHDVNDRVVSFEIAGLDPGRRYYYGVQSRGEVDRSRIGFVRTFPRRPFSFTFAVGGCARSGSNGAVFDAIRRKNPLFFLILGDLFYGNIDDNDPEEFANQYERALSRAAPAALYRTAPVDYVWDDHDYGPDDSDSSSPSREAALVTYRAYAPHYPLADDESIYHSFVVGRVRFVVTDNRSARTGVTMLGSRQKSWLKRELLAAKRAGQLAVWTTTVPWIVAAEQGADSWAGFAAERRELAEFVVRSRIDDLLMLAGDAHMVAVDDGTNNRYAAGLRSGFPVMHAAALDRRGSFKGGPYSEGAHPGSGQFGTVTIRDDGGATVSVTLSGWNYRGGRILEHTFTRNLGTR